MKNIRLIAALALAFGSLAFAQPALASDWITSNGNAANGTVQFDWRGGSATQTLTVAEGSILSVTVNNTIANCIGSCTPIPDTWSLTINGERWEGNSIDIITIQTVVSGEVTLVATGKDEGFWGGWYGPIFSAVTVTEPAPTPTPTPEPVETGTWEGQVFTATAPEGQVFTAVTGWYGAPNDSTCGADVSTILATFLGSNTFTVGSDNGVFGDPCGGVVKVLRVQLTAGGASVDTTDVLDVSNDTTDTTDTTGTTDTTDVVDVSTDVVEPVVPVVPPVVQPPVVEPAPQPQPIPFPVEPEPQPQPQPELPLPEETQAPEPPVEQTPEPALPEVPEVLPEPEVTQEPEPPVEEKPLPELPIEPPIVETVEEHSTTVIDEIAELEPSELSNAQVAQLAAVADAIFAVAEQGSPAYEKALEALAIIAEADDAELPTELAVIPLLGDAAGAVLEAFNNLGNIGADMSPVQREKAEETVVAAVVVGQIATAAATSAGISAAASTRKIK